jgi:DNA-binding CsgD family transcriptional regulator
VGSLRAGCAKVRRSVGYLLKDRVANVAEFTDAIARIAAGGTALDPEVVAGLLDASRHASALATLTAREHNVLALMAEGRSNGAIAERLIVSERAVEKHISNIFSKLGLPPSDPTTAGCWPSSRTSKHDPQQAGVLASGPLQLSPGVRLSWGSASLGQAGRPSPAGGTPRPRRGGRTRPAAGCARPGCGSSGRTR